MINAIDETSPALVPVNSQELEWFPSRVNALAPKWFRGEPNHKLTQREIFYRARVNASQTPPPIRNNPLSCDASRMRLADMNCPVRPPSSA
jgi:hypothetical protein